MPLLKEQFEAESGTPSRPKGCSVCHLEQTLPEEEADILRRMVASPEWGPKRIADSLRNAGHEVGGRPPSSSTVRRHLNRDCGRA